MVPESITDDAEHAADLDLKVDDTGSELQTNDLLDLEEVKVQSYITAKPQVTQETEELADFQAQGIGVGLNEQQGRNVMLTY